MNHCIRGPSKNLLFLVKDPVLTTASTTAVYAGKMLWGRAWLHRFTNWAMRIWAAAWQSCRSVTNLTLRGLLSREASAIFVGVEHGLSMCWWSDWSWGGWMEKGVWKGVWRDWCYKGGPVMPRDVKHGKDQLLITRPVQVIGQNCFPSVFHGKMSRLPVDLPAAVGEALHPCLWPAVGAA